MKNENLQDYILVADAGSTKCEWCLICPNGTEHLVHTHGINPITQNDECIRAILMDELCPSLATMLPHEQVKIDIYYYGAGCIPGVCERMSQLLTATIPHVSKASVHSDLLGAARALCGHHAGIACILGTGANSCLYDGKDIVQHTSPLGYILGDEGSGAYIGKRLVGDVLKGLLPTELCENFLERYSLSESIIINKVYREPGANSFLASLTPFLAEHRSHPEIHQLLVSCFTEFFHRNIDNYKQPLLPVNFVGSIALHFQPELEEAAHGCGYRLGRILQRPITLMAQYHIDEQGTTGDK